MCQCGKEFEPTCWNQKFCEKECRKNYVNVKYYTKTCTVCGKVFYRKSYKFFCSNACRDIKIRENKKRREEILVVEDITIPDYIKEIFNAKEIPINTNSIL